MKVQTKIIIAFLINITSIFAFNNSLNETNTTIVNNFEIINNTEPLIIDISPYKDKGTKEVKFVDIKYKPNSEINSKIKLKTKYLTKGERVYSIIQFNKNPSNHEITGLKKEGIELLNYISSDTWYVSISQDLDNVFTTNNDGDIKLKNNNFNDKYIVRSIDEIKPEFKLSKYIRENNIGNWAKDRKGNMYLLIQVQNGVNLENLNNLVQNLGGKILNKIKSINTLTISIPENKINDLSNINEIKRIETISPNVEDKISISKTRINVNSLYTSPYNLDGNGITILQYEINVPDNEHEDLNGRTTNPELLEVESNHATLVAGIMIGNGTLNSSLKGIAPKSQIVAYEVDGGSNLYNNTNDIETEYLGAISSYGARLVSNSWGIESDSSNCDYLGDYTLVSSLLDDISLNYKFPIVWANGNERIQSNGSLLCNRSYNTVLPKASAKNVISVGNIYDSDVSQYEVYKSSSYGPTDDGRIKPEFVAPGCRNLNSDGIVSTIKNDQYGDLGCGSSISAPHVSGTIALMLEEWDSLYTNEPLSSTIKSLLIDSAQDLSNSGNGDFIDDGPSYVNGFGLLNAKEAVDRIINGTFKEENMSDSNDVDVYSINITSQTKLKVTLAWDDVPGANLVNDLNLKLTSPSGIVFYPWTLNPNQPNLTAVRTQEDHLNNVEQVYANSSDLGFESGEWLVVISATCNQDCPQKYSLVSENNISTNYKGLVMTDDVIGFYKLDNNAHDYSFNNHSGQESAGFNYSTTAHLVKSAYFDGSDYIESSTFPNLRGNMSVDFWFNANDLTSEGDIISKSYSGDLSYIFGVYGGKPRLLWKTDSSGAWNSLSGSWSTGTWYHITVTYDTEDVKVYVDGTLRNTFSAYGGLIRESNEELAFGRRSDKDTVYFNGYLDEVSIWNKTLESYEVKMLDEKGLISNESFTASSTVLTADSSLLGHYQFENDLTDSNSNYDITSSNSITYSSGHQTSDYASVFDGSSSFTSINNFPNTNENMTLSVWFNADDFSTEADIVSKSGSADLSYILGIYSGNPRVLWKTDDSGAWNSLSGTWSTGTWYNVVLVYDMTKLAVYKDGEYLQSFSGYGGNIRSSSQSLNFGVRNESEGKYYDGKIDEISIWNRTLDANEIEELYNNGITYE
ncbi:MAG: S8 family serine peptidase [Nanoarchaeota archaeon]|nr:S8 family serine peptidase [Nanoarchaeota archaeon]